MRTKSGKLAVMVLAVCVIFSAALLVSAAGWQPDPAKKLAGVVKNSQVKIDGDLSDWKGAKWEKILPNPATNLKKVVTDPADASLEFAVQWDENNIYFAGKGTDNDMFVNTATGENAWDGDCIEFFISFKPQGMSGGVPRI